MFKHLLIGVVLIPLTAPTALQANDRCEHVYKVRKNDTLIKIGKRFTRRYTRRYKTYKVTARSLRRWNRLRSSRIRPGQKLVIKKPVPLCRRRTFKYRIKKGDTLLKIAKHFKVRVKDIKRWNRLKSSRIRRGKKLMIQVPGPSKKSKSTGSPQHGKLVDGERLPEGRSRGWGYWAKKPKYSYGANVTVTNILDCIRLVKRKWRRAHDVVIGDISKEGGGFLPPHVSHQSGLDVDIGYYHKGRKPPKGFRTATAANLDVRKSWALIKAFIDTGDVDLIFVDHGLQALLYRHAQRRGASKKTLKKLFQYPRGRGTGQGKIRHSKGHKNHYHVRFKEREESE
jgi:LysM repeat protein